MLTWTRREWTGAYFDGRTAGRTEVGLRFTDEGVHVTGLPAGDAFWYLYEVRLAEATSPNDPVRIERVSSGEAVVVADPALRTSVAMALGGHPTGSRGGRPLGLARQVGVLLVAAVTFVTSLYLWVIPWMASRAAQRVPLEWEERLGAAMVRSVTGAGVTCVEPARLAALARMTDALTADGRGGRYTFHVTILDDSLVNAMAAPGGQLVFFRGLLDAAESPEELAGVLAHEIQHVVLRHGTTGILRQIPLQLLVASVTGSGGIGESAIGAAATLGNLGYARGDETAADREGMRMLQAARVGTEGMVSFMARLSTLNDGELRPGIATYLSTHPASEDRARALADLAAGMQYAPTPLLSADEWAAVKAPCERPAASRSMTGTAARR